MEICSAALRGTIIAPPGKKLIIIDYANIEGRLAAWITHEEWKIKAFEAYDRKEGEDLYKVAYSKMFKIDVKTVNKQQRQIGKYEELSKAYQGGVGATARTAVKFNIDLGALADEVYDSIPSEKIDEATDFLLWQKKEKRGQHGLTDKAFIVWDAVKRLWREANPQITAVWKQLEEAAINAVENPGKVYTVHRHKFKKSGSWLRISRPNGNCLVYPQIKIENGKLTYLGKNQITHKWERTGTYGGKIFENMCQAVAGDLLKHAVRFAERCRYKTVLTVHDELVVEVPDTEEYSLEKLGKILTKAPKWANGLPLAYSGFEAYRYGKAD